MGTNFSASDNCYLCGTALADGEQNIEHVVPKSLFARKEGGLITLPAHKACNSSYAMDDEYFRLCMAIATGPSDPTAKQVWDGPIMRGLQRPDRPGLKKQVLSRLFPVNVQTPAGIYLGRAEAMYQDSTRLLRVVTRITRGLYAKETSTILPLDWPVSGDLIDHVAAKPLYDLLKIRFSPVADGAFHYAWKCLEEDDREGFFWMVFYRTVHFWGYTGTRLKEILSPSHASK